MDNVPVNASSLADGQVSSSCCAWGACIETTLLADLSEEERSRLAEHTITCSACARRFQKYQAIEEFAGEIPQYDLRGHARYPSWMPEARLKEKRKSNAKRTMFAT